MARQTLEANLQTPTARQRLSQRPEPYYRAVGQGLALGYRRGLRGGTWLARIRDPNRDAYREIKLGRADDPPARADNVATFSYDQALQRAREVQAREEARRISGVAPGAEKKSLNDVFDLYVKGYVSGEARRGELPGRDLKNVKSILDRHLRPALGEIRINELNSERLENLKRTLASSPRLTRSGQPVGVDKNGTGKAVGHIRARQDLVRTVDVNWEVQRKRRARANRIITVLRAALNFALAKKLIANDAAWKFALAPFANVDGPTIRYLSLDECERLLSVLDADFSALAKAALLTGARYGSLIFMTASDVDLQARTASLRVTKSGKLQSVPLTKAACVFMCTMKEGKSPNDLLFCKASGERWKASDQIRRMVEGCALAGISPPIGFHGLRDTFTSHLVMRGVPILLVSKLLGHSDTRTTEKYYAHLAPDHLHEVLEDKLPHFFAASS